MMGTGMSQPGERHSSSPGNSASWQARLASSAQFTLPRNKPMDKKKKSKLATLKKKLSNRVHKKQNKQHDQAKALREHLSSWSPRDLHALVRDYEAGLALRELTCQADLSRPKANTLKEDLAALYEKQYFADVQLVYEGKTFPAHRAILSVRCPYFRELLPRYPDDGARIKVTIRTPGVTVGLFSALLKYLYTGDLCIDKEDSSAGAGNNLNLLIQLAGEFGTPNPLESDLRSLLESCLYADALLVFSPSPSSGIQLHGEMCFEHAAGAQSGRGGGRDSRHNHHGGSGLANSQLRLHSSGSSANRLELRCHKAILAARSPFFRHLLLRRSAQKAEHLTSQQPTSSTHRRKGKSSTPSHISSASADSLLTEIELDEAVISRRYARVLLHACYLDQVDLSCIVRSSVSMCSLSEVQAMVSGRATHLTINDEAVEIYQIGQFLEIPIIIQGCENLIVQNLGVENLVPVLDWSLQPHGSAWVGRQALHFLREDFLQVAHSPVLLDLSQQHLIQAVSSDFLQASEVEVLSAILKWGEHQLMKRMEEREPNLLSHTAHSVSRKGVRRRDLSDVELREVLAQLLPHIRVEHVVPRNHQTLVAAIKRGLLCTPPSHMLGEDIASQIAAWIPGKHYSVYTKPRVYTVYYEEAKSLFEERLTQTQQSDSRPRLIHHCGLPDPSLQDWGHHGVGVRDPSLQEWRPHGVSVHAISPTPRSPQQPIQPAFTCPPSTLLGLDIIAVPSHETCEAMRRRELELCQDLQVRRFLSLPRADRPAMIRQLRLKVVRQFGLPDSSVQVLDEAEQHGGDVGGGDEVQITPRREHDGQHGIQMDQQLLDEARYHTPRRHKPPKPEASSRQFSRSSIDQEEEFYFVDKVDQCTCGQQDSALSHDIPDIAMATSRMHSMSLNRAKSAALCGHSYPSTSHDATWPPSLPPADILPFQEPYYQPSANLYMPPQQLPFNVHNCCHEARGTSTGARGTSTGDRRVFRLRTPSPLRSAMGRSVSREVSPSTPPDIGLDLGDGTSHHSGSRGSTGERGSPVSHTVYV